jgi:hypothetical protein
MDVVAEVCEIATRFKARGDVSVLKLVDESGYRSSPTALSADAVTSYLARHQALVDAWIGYSEDKRVSSGWYIVETSGHRFEVGYYPRGGCLCFEDRDRACAEFIVREVRSIAG